MAKAVKRKKRFKYQGLDINDFFNELVYDTCGLDVPTMDDILKFESICMIYNDVHAEQIQNCTDGSFVSVDALDVLDAKKREFEGYVFFGFETVDDTDFADMLIDLHIITQKYKNSLDC